MSDIPKRMKIETKEDAIFFLHRMIYLAIKRMDRYKNLISDIDSVIKDNAGKKYIDILVGNQLFERMESLNLFLCNLYADETQNVISYVWFRKTVEKKLCNSEIKLSNWNDETIKIIEELKDRRNWVHHIPHTTFTSEIEFQKEQGMNEFWIRKLQTNYQIDVWCYKYVAMDLIKELSHSCKVQYDDYRKVLQAMKKDYSMLTGKSVRINREYIDEPKNKEVIEVQDNSFKRNRRKR